MKNTVINPRQAFKQLKKQFLPLLLISTAYYVTLGTVSCQAADNPAASPGRVSQVKVRNGKSYVVANGRALLMYGVQLRVDHIMSPYPGKGDWSLAEPYFKNAAYLGFKTVIVPVSWSRIEKSSGVYDFATYVDKIIDSADRYGLSVQLLWYGSDVCGWELVPPFVRADRVQFPRHPKYDNYFDLSNEKLRRQEASALSAMMNHIAEYDHHNRIIMVQVENEPDGAGPIKVDYHNVADKDEKLFAGGQFEAVNQLVNEMGRVVHASKRDVVTRCNLGTPYRASEFYAARLKTAGGCDIYGVDIYASEPEVTKVVLASPTSDASQNVLHQPEGSGRFGNLTNLILSNFEEGGGYLIYELRTVVDSDFGIYRRASSALDWTPRDGKTLSDYWYKGTPGHLELETASLQAFNNCIYKADQQIALVKKGDCAAFNVQAALGDVQETRNVGRTKVGFQTANGGTGFALQTETGDLVLLCFADQATFTLPDLATPPLYASIGAYGADNVWVESAKRPLQGKAFVLTRGEVARITY